MTSSPAHNARLGAAAVIWLCLWLVPWQGALEGLPWARVVIAIAMFVVPGGCLQQFLDPSARASTSRFLSLGFCVSLALTGFLGIVARAANLSIDFVNTGLMAIGLLGIFWASRSLGAPKIATRQAALQVGFAIPLIVATLLVVYLTSVYSQQTDIDFATHHAQVTDFQGASELDYTHFVFGSDVLLSKRFLISYWTLGQAVLASNAGMHIIELYPLLMVAVALLAMLAVFELASGLGLPRVWAQLASIAQVAMLTTLWEENEVYRVGRTFLQYTLLDNNVATHVFAPLLLRVVADYLASFTGRRLVLVVLMAFGTLFVHPGMLGLLGLIIGFYVALGALLYGWSRKEAALLTPLALVAAIPFSFRLFWREQVLPSSLDQMDYVPRGVTLLGDSGLYSVTIGYLLHPPFIPVVLAEVVALFHVRRCPAARYVLACLLALGLTLIPHSASLVGSAVTPTILARVLWLMPFGLATSFLLLKLFERVADRSPFDSRLVGTGLCSVAAAGMAFAVYTGHPIQFRDEIRYPTGSYLRLARKLDALLPERAIVVGDKELNSHLPSLSANAKTFIHRIEHQTFKISYLKRLGAFSEEETRRRIEDWRSIRRSTAGAERVRLLKRYAASYYITASNFGRRPGLTLVDSVDRYHIYRVD